MSSEPAAQPIRYPVWSRIVARIMAEAEGRGNADHRRANLAGLSGRVIELGAGTGLNFAHYPATVTEVVAAEPEPSLREQAAAAAGTAPIQVSVVDWPAEALDAADAEFDAGVASLVLCCVRDQRQALAELRRVIRPGGELRYYEHIRARRRGFAAVQVAIDRAGFPLVAGNEHLSRRTDRRIREAGFEVLRERYFRFLPQALDIFSAPHVMGVARRPLA